MSQLSDDFITTTPLTLEFTSRDIDVLSSRLATRQLLNYGWEVADLDNLVPFSSIDRVAPDIVERYARLGALAFLKGELKRKDPRVLFYRLHCAKPIQLRFHYREIPHKLAKLILSLLNRRTKNVPIDYLVLNSEGYSFVELKANKSQLSKKQTEVIKKIQSEGYSVSVLHVIFDIGVNAVIKIKTLFPEEH